VVVVVDDVLLVVTGTDVLVVATVVEVLATVVDVASVVLVEVVGGTVLVGTALVDVVLGAVVVVVLTWHGSGSQVPGPRSMPFCASHASGDRTSQVKAPIGLSNAPPTDDGTQHWISGQVQQLVPVPAVP
jgi:hypothetical protein